MNKVTQWINNKRKLLCIILLTLLSLLLLKQTLDFTHNFRWSGPLINEASELYYTIKHKDYQYLLNEVAYNEAKDETAVSDTTEYVAFAKYYQAAIYYKAYLDKNQTEADKYLRTMTENEAKITSDIMKDELKKLKEILYR